MNGADRPQKRPQGFASFSPEKRRRVAGKGGRSAQALGRAHRFTHEEAVEAGRKGGKAVRHRDGPRFNRVRLLHGPYLAPALRRGDRAFCLLRDTEVVITNWTDAPISWPRCRAVDSPGPGSGLLVDEELARAIRSESALAIRHWWGVGSAAVWAWRKAFGIARDGTEGSRRLLQEARRITGLKQRGKVISPAVREESSERAKRLNLARILRAHPAIPPWTAEEVALLGTTPDEEVAKRIGRPVNAVRVKRTKLGIPTARDRRRRE